MGKPPEVTDEAREAREHDAFEYFRAVALNCPDVEHEDDWLIEWRTFLTGWNARIQYDRDNWEPPKDW